LFYLKKKKGGGGGGGGAVIGTAVPGGRLEEINILNEKKN